MATKKPAPAPKQKSWSDYTTQEKAGIVVAIIIVLFLLITLKGLIFGGSDSKDTSKNNEVCIADLTGKSNEDKLKQIANDAALNCDGMANAVREVRVIPELDGTYSVNVTFFDESFKYSIIKQTAGNIYYELYKSGILLETVTVAAKNSYLNQYGDDAEIIVLQTQITKDVVDKINLDADKALLQMNIIPDLWTVQKVHDDIKEQF